MTKPSIYIESSVVSYYANEIRSNSKIASEQILTRNWWKTVLPKMDTYVSEFVFREVLRGKPKYAQARLEAISGVTLLPFTDEVKKLAAVYVRKLALPKDGEADAFHLAMAAVHEVDFLVSWNCKHIANAFKYPLIRKININQGWRSPTICTPRELMEV